MTRKLIEQDILQHANQLVHVYPNPLITFATFVKLVEAPTDAGLEAWLKSDALEKSIKDSVSKCKIQGARKYENITKKPVKQAYTLLKKNELSTGIFFDRTAVPALACLLTIDWATDKAKWAPDFVQDSPTIIEISSSTLSNKPLS
jgi:hypothetical protein